MVPGGFGATFITFAMTEILIGRGGGSGARRFFEEKQATEEPCNNVGWALTTQLQTATYTLYAQE